MIAVLQGENRESLLTWRTPSPFFSNSIPDLTQFFQSKPISPKETLTFSAWLVLRPR